MPPQTRSLRTKLVLYLLVLAALVAALICLLPPLRRPPGEPPAPPPAELPAVALTSTTAPASRPAGEPEATTQPSQWALPLTDEERIIYDTVFWRPQQLDEEARDILLARVAALPPLTAAAFDRLPRPGYDQLLTRPRTYGAEKMSLRVLCWRVTRLTAGVNMSTSPQWPKDRDVWWIDATVHGAQPADSEPVILLSVIDPAAVLGKASRAADERTSLYFKPQAVEVAGVFYKIYEATDLGTRTQPASLRRWPVLLVWQIRGGGSGWASRASLIALAVGIAGAVVLVALFIVLMKRRTQPLRAPTGFVYRPTRDELDAEEAAGDVEVDPLLKKAAEEYRKEKHPGEDRPR